VERRRRTRNFRRKGRRTGKKEEEGGRTGIVRVRGQLASRNYVGRSARVDEHVDRSTASLVAVAALLSAADRERDGGMVGDGTGDGSSVAVAIVRDTCERRKVSSRKK
jgi:hypothetical protein